MQRWGRLTPGCMTWHDRERRKWPLFIFPSAAPTLSPPSPLSPLPTLTVTHGGCKDTWGPLIGVKCVLQGGVIDVLCPPLSQGPLSSFSRQNRHQKGEMGLNRSEGMVFKCPRCQAGVVWNHRSSELKVIWDKDVHEEVKNCGR